MKKTTLTVSILIYAFTSLALGKNSLFNEDNPKIDTLRIKDYSDKLNIYAGFFSKIHSVEFNNTELDKKLIYDPNEKINIGLGFNYRWLGLGVSFSPGFMNSDDDIYGETDSLDAQLNLYGRAIGVDAYFQYYKGFYLRNPDDFTSWKSKSQPLSPDLESLSTGISAYYITNHKKFSYKAAYTRTQFQKKSAGSFIVGLYANLNAAAAPSYIIPQEFSDTLSKYYNINAYRTASIGISAGYSYTLVFFKRFFINGTLVPGFGFRNVETWSDGKIIPEDPSAGATVTIRFALGFEGKRI